MLTQTNDNTFDRYQYQVADAIVIGHRRPKRRRYACTTLSDYDYNNMMDRNRFEIEPNH